MFFKNLTTYRIDMGAVTATELESMLLRHPLIEPGAMDIMTRGFVPTFEGSTVFSASGCHLMAIGICEKLLPGSVVTQAAQKRAAEIEDQQGRTETRRRNRRSARLQGRTQADARDQRPDHRRNAAKCILRMRKTHAWIDSANGLLVVDAATPSKADEFIEAFSKAAPDISIRTLRTHTAPSLAMTSWLQFDDPDTFTIDSDQGASRGAIWCERMPRSASFILRAAWIPRADAMTANAQVQAGPAGFTAGIAPGTEG